MAAFTKLSLRNMIVLPIVTLGVYFLGWIWATKDELNKAGGRVPSIFFSFISPFLLLVHIHFSGYDSVNVYLNWHWAPLIQLIPLYFWVCYTQAYVNIVKKSTRFKDFIYYFALIILPYTFGSFLYLLPILFPMQVLINFVEMHKIPCLLGVISGVYLLNLMRMVIFQKGFNEYKPLPISDDSLGDNRSVNFTLSLHQMIIMPIITYGLYSWYWMWATKEELNKVGRRIPSIFLNFIFLPGMCYGIAYLMLLKWAPAYATLQFMSTDVYFRLGLGIICSLFSIYFWWRYTQSYVTIVKKSFRSADFWYYFTIAMMPGICSFLIESAIRSKLLAGEGLGSLSSDKLTMLSMVTLPVALFIIDYAFNLTRMLIFQKGFNEYQD